MKASKILFFSLICLMAFSANAQEYVDLGLPSGTLWKDVNEEEALYNYYDALDQFDENLPTLSQLRELKSKCTWTWTGKGYKVTGPNGNSIILPVTGFSDCAGNGELKGSGGSYWSSAPVDAKKAWFLGFGPGSVSIGNDMNCYGRAVRLVRSR